MDESIDIDRSQTSKHFDFNKYIYKEADHCEDETVSPFSLTTNDCKYFTLV